MAWKNNTNGIIISTRGPRIDKSKSIHTFEVMCDLWMLTKGRLATKTKIQYRNALEIWKDMFGPDTRIASLTHSDVAAQIGSYPWTSPRLVNNYLIALRGVFRMACREIDMDNPMDGIENSKRQAVPPDPLSIHEMCAVLTWLKGNCDVVVWAYFEFAFLTGMRPEELIALKWQDLDHDMRSIQVIRARTGGEFKALKTYHARYVDLVTRSRSALEVMRPITGGSEDGFIFLNPVTDRPWHDDRSQRDFYWKPALKASKIRYRRSYCTRHTFATVAILAGVNPAYVATQLGHANARMLFTVYAKWINSADNARENTKLEAWLLAAT